MSVLRQTQDERADSGLGLKRVPLKWELLPAAILGAGVAYTLIKYPSLAASSAAKGPVDAAPSGANLSMGGVLNFLIWGGGLYLLLSLTQVMVSSDRFVEMKFSGFKAKKVRRLGYVYSAIIFAAKCGIMALFVYVQILSLRAMEQRVELRLDRRDIAPAILGIIAIFLGGLYFLYREFTATEPE